MKTNDGAPKEVTHFLTQRPGRGFYRQRLENEVGRVLTFRRPEAVTREINARCAPLARIPASGNDASRTTRRVVDPRCRDTNSLRSRTASIGQAASVVALAAPLFKLGRAGNAFRSKRTTEIEVPEPSNRTRMDGPPRLKLNPAEPTSSSTVPSCPSYGPHMILTREPFAIIVRLPVPREVRPDFALGRPGASVGDMMKLPLAIFCSVLDTSGGKHPPSLARASPATTSGAQDARSGAARGRKQGSREKRRRSPQRRRGRGEKSEDYHRGGTGSTE